MNLKISTININKNSLNLFNLKHNNKVIKNITNPSAMKSLPIVTIPLVAYYESSTSRNNLAKNLAKEAISKTSNNATNTPISDRTKKNLEALKKAGVPERERMKYINSNGYMDSEGKEICQNNNVTSFTGKPDDPQPYEPDIPDYSDIHSDIPTSGGGFSTIEPDQHAMGFGQISAGFDELELLDSADITEQLGHVADMLDNPVLEGVAAELLPRTKFLKPGKDLIDGDYEKAA